MSRPLPQNGVSDAAKNAALTSSSGDFSDIRASDSAKTAANTIKIPQYQKTTLKNGFEIYTCEHNKGSSVISIDLFYKVGSRNEIMGKSGIAHMLEHLNFKSTKTRPAGEFDKIVKGFGGVNNASTGFDYTHYYIKCASQNLDASLDLYADIMANLSLKDEEFQPERAVVLEERRWRTDNSPMGLLYFRLFNTAFTHHPYHWTPIGFFSDIENWDIEDIRDFHATYYQPQNAFLMITGDIDDSGSAKLAAKYFSPIKNTRPLPKIHTFEAANYTGEKMATIHFDSEVEMLALAFKIPPFNHPDIPALNALSEYLSGGKSSVLSRVLVDQKRLANEIYAYPLDSIDENLFIIIAVANPGITAHKLKDEILKLLTPQNIAQREIERIKNALKSDLIYSISSSSSTANLVGSYIARGDLAPLNSLYADTTALTPAVLKQTAKRYFNIDNSTTIFLKGKL